MRRFLLTLGAASLLAVATPASALAHHHGRRLHRAHAHQVHFRRFGSLDQTTSPASTSTPASGIGTIASFQNGVLTILLNDGSTVAGNVTGDTAITCPSSGSSQGSDDTGDSSDESQSSGGDQNQSSSGDQSQSSGGDDQSDQSSGGDDQSDQSSGGDESSSGSNGSCSSADLANGKTVMAAELRIDSAGKTWEKIDLGS